MHKPNRHAMIVTGGVVPLSHGGGANNLYSEVLALKDLGYSIAVVFWHHPDSNAGGTRHWDYLKDVRLIDLTQTAPSGQGFRGVGPVADLKVFLQRFRSLSLPARFGTDVYAETMADFVTRLKPKIVIAQTYPALSLLRKVTTAPILLEAEPFPSLTYYLSQRYRVLPNLSGFRRVLSLIKILIVYAVLRRQEIALARRSTHIGAFDPNDAKFLEQRLKRPVSVLRCPVVDQLTGRQYMRSKEKKKIIMVGHLRGLVSLCSLEYLTDHLIDRMQKEIREPFELHIIGGYDLPGRFQKLRAYKNVVFRGQIDDIEPEFKMADIVLSTSTFDFGSSTRVRTALVFGSALVANRNSSRGIPELLHKYNSLLSETPDDFIRNINQCFADPNLCETLRRNARSTYQKFFSIEAHSKQLASLIEITLEQYQSNGQLEGWLNGVRQNPGKVDGHPWLT